MEEGKGRPGRPKGGKRYGGRPKGKPNKTTIEVRDAYKQLVENNLENIEGWLKAVAGYAPDKALDFMLKFSEYFIPKLNRTEVTGLNGGAIEHNVTWVVPNANQLAIEPKKEDDEDNVSEAVLVP